MDRKISIIIPVYNKEKYIEKLINSIEKQTYTNYEIIIVNDGSTDKSLEICERLAKERNKIKLITQKNKGVSTARNTGIENASGDNIIFVDADDILEETYLEDLSKEIEKFDLVICGYYLLNEKLNKNTIRVFDKAQKEQIVGIQETISIWKKELLNILWNKIFKASIIKKYDVKFIPEISLGEDTLFVLEYLKHINTKIKILNIPLYNYILRESGINLGSKETIEQRINRIIYTKNQMDELYKINRINEHKNIDDAYLKNSIIPIMARYYIKDKRFNILERRRQLKNIIKTDNMQELLANITDRKYKILLNRYLILMAYILLKLKRKEKHE